MVWRFLKHYGMNKATGVLDEFAAAVVAFDPQAASKAQIDMMKTELDKLGTKLAEAEAEVRREHRETLELKQNYDQYLRAAHVLEGKLSDPDGVGASGHIEASLAKIVDRLEHLKPEIEREEREDQEVEAWRSELRRAYEELARKIRSAHTELKSARRQMDMAKLKKERALEQDRRAKEAAGLSNSISSLSVALDSMNRETAKVRAETEALKLRAGVMGADNLQDDPNIAAALTAVRGKSSLERGSLAERLAKLSARGKQKQLTASA